MEPRRRDVKADLCEAGGANGQLVRRMDVHVLLGGARELILMHQGDEYHLRITKNEKLILTK